MTLSSRTRNFVADTLALVIFFTIASGVNERLVAGLSWPEVGVSRLIGAPLMVLTARPYGMWRDCIFRLASPPGRWGKAAVDAFALMAFQVPIYAAILATAGADGSAILRGVIGFAALMLVLGRPYGVWLDFVRALFGLEGPGQKPMSLGG